jgi:aminoglycoside phosphotransferase (APT) family kinase protein
VAGSPFFVMEYVTGPIVQEPEQALDLTPSERARAAGSLFEVLAAIHTVDLASCDLADLARHGGYVERQLRRWHQQYLSVRTRDLPHLEEVFGWLLANHPPETSVGLIHGDFRLDNVILGEDCSVTAVLDWELSTLGEPLADLGLTLAYWLHDGDDEALVPRASTVSGFPSRDEMAERYALATGAEIDNLHYYIAMGHWKVACIAEGVYSRYMAGDMGEASIDVAHFERHPPARAAAAAELIRAGV